MIRAERFPVFEGPVCDIDKYDAPSISRRVYRVFYSDRSIVGVFCCKHKPTSG